MDHLPGAKNVVDVPYYGGVFDDGDWDTFPSRQGWNQDLLLNGNLEGRSIDDVTVLLQTWAYLGLLCKLTNQSFHSVLSQFTTLRLGSKIITTSSLPSTFFKLHQQNKKTPNESHNAYRWAAMRYFRQIQLRHSLPKALVLSLSILFEDLSFLGGEDDWTSGATLAVLQDDLIAIGCCPASLEVLRNRLGSSGLYLRYLMGTLKSKHTHINCSNTRCMAFRTVEGSYISGHANDCSRSIYSERETGLHFPCGWITPTARDLANVLDSGTFPVLCVERDSAKFTVTIADGMGNFEKNELRTCHVADVFRLLQTMDMQSPPGYSAGSTDYFWIDTLCIPIKGDPNRKAGLLRLKDVYKEATNVLVIDDELRQFEPPNDIFAAIAVIVSPWGSRLWTLEEVILAQLPFVQFSGSLVNLRHLGEQIAGFGRLKDDFSTGTWCKALSGLHARIYSWRNWDLDEIHRAPITVKYSILVGALEFRETSKLTDEAFCLSSILDLDLRPILDSAEAHRMTAFWLSQPLIPLKLIFIIVPRLHEPGMRWAPRSLIGVHKLGNWNLFMGEDLGRVTSQGLVFRSSAFIFPSPNQVLNWPIAFRLRDGFEAQLLSGEHLLQYGEIPLTTIKTLAVLHARDKRVGRYGNDSMNHVALFNVVQLDNNRARAEYLGIMLMLSDQRAFATNVSSTCVNGQQQEIEWLLT